jgi:Tol biopolymer transport system component
VIKAPSAEVLKEGRVLKLEPQVLSFLLLLIQHKEHVVTKEEIITEVWSGKTASDDAVRALVKKLRSALGDNARAPKFVKTVPLQGYLFIMPVVIEFNQLGWWRSRYVIYCSAAILIILTTLLIQAQFGSFQANTNNTIREVTISKITDMKGSEVSPYLSKNNKLLFSHRSKNDESLQLYVKDLNSNASKRLTWGSASFTDGIFSPDASQAVVQKSQNESMSLQLFNFDLGFNITSVEHISLDEAFQNTNINAISYSTNGKNLYLSLDVIAGKDIDAHSGSKLIRYNIESKAVLNLAFSFDKGATLISAIESNDEKYLAVLVHIGNKAEIHVQHLDTEEIILKKPVPELPTSIVWAANSLSITFATTNGNLLNLNILNQRIYGWSGLSFEVSEVVSECAEYCFVLKELEANLLNIVEQPLSFDKLTYISTLQFSLTSADRFPTYFDNGKGLFFLSLSDNQLVINRYTEFGDVEVIYELPKTSHVNSLILSPDEKVFAGELDGRIFLYNVNNGTLSFLTPRGTKSTNPVWSLQGDELFYHQTVNGKSVIYAQDIVSKKIRVLGEGLRLIFPLDASQWLLVDENQFGFIHQSDVLLADKVQNEAINQQTLNKPIDIPVFSKDLLSTSLKFAQLDSIGSNGLDVQNQSLFFMSKNANTMFLNRLDLETKSLEQVELKSGPLLQQFDIHPSMQKMLTVTSSLSQSNLLKVSGLTLESRQVKQVITETP